MVETKNDIFLWLLSISIYYLKIFQNPIEIVFLELCSIEQLSYTVDFDSCYSRGETNMREREQIKTNAESNLMFHFSPSLASTEWLKEATIYPIDGLSIRNVNRALRWILYSSLTREVALQGCLNGVYSVLLADCSTFRISAARSFNVRELSLDEKCRYLFVIIQWWFHCYCRRSIKLNC